MKFRNIKRHVMVMGDELTIIANDEDTYNIMRMLHRAVFRDGKLLEKILRKQNNLATTTYISQYAPLSIIYNNRTISWNWHAVSANSSLTREFIREYDRYRLWDYGAIITNPDVMSIEELQDISQITNEQIIERMNFNWGPNEDEMLLKIGRDSFDYDEISGSYSIVPANVFAHPECFWDWLKLSANPAFTIADIMAHPELPWEWEGVSRNPTVTMEIIKAHPNMPWNEMEILQNPNVTWDVVRKILNGSESDLMGTFMTIVTTAHRYFKSELYKRRLAKQFNDVIFEELIIVACHPRRYEWYLDTEDLAFRQGLN